MLVVNSLSVDIFLDSSKLKAFSDNKKDVTQILKSVLGRIQNIVAKGKKCWLPNPIPQVRGNLRLFDKRSTIRG